MQKQININKLYAETKVFLILIICIFLVEVKEFKNSIVTE